MAAVETAVLTGDRRKALEALRDHLAGRIAGADDRVVAGIVKQLADVLRELDDMPAAKEGSVVNDLAARRAKRRSTASSS